MAAPFDEEDRQTLRDLHEAGRSLGGIAKAMGRSRSTVSTHAARMGLTFDRGQTQAATVAVVVDAKAKRAALQTALLDDAERLRTRLWQPSELHSFGGAEHTHRRIELELPVPKDQKDLMAAIGQAVTSSLRLDEHDSDTGSAQAVSMIGDLMASLAAHRPPEPVPDVDDEEVTGT